MKIKFELYQIAMIIAFGMLFMFAIDIYLGPPEDRGKLPADYGMDNPPVMICLDKAENVIPCE